MNEFGSTFFPRGGDEGKSTLWERMNNGKEGRICCVRGRN